MVPYTILLEPLSECLILGACASWGAHTLSGGSIDPYAFYMVHVLVWFLLDWILLNIMQVITKLSLNNKNTFFYSHGMTKYFFNILLYSEIKNSILLMYYLMVIYIYICIYYCI